MQTIIAGKICGRVHKQMGTFRLFGFILIICALLGYIFVADELHHFGELLGVTSIFLAGVLLILKETKLNILRKLAIQWISFGLLISIPVGGVLLNNMPIGITICFLTGLILAYVFRKKI